MRPRVAVLLLLGALHAALCQVPSDWAAGVASSQLLFAQSEPIDRNFMPAIANGFLGTTVGAGGFSIGGVYNGYNFTTPSHRAVLPASLALSITNGKVVACALDLLNGAYYRRSIIPADNGGAITIQQTFYAHRVYRQLLVHQLSWVTATPGVTAGLVSFKNNATITTDFSFSNVSNSSTLLSYAARTRQSETPTSPLAYVGVATDQAPLVVSLQAGQSVAWITVVHTSLEGLSSPYAAALQDYGSIKQNETAQTLFASHSAAWQTLWSSTISITGDSALAGAINASIYAILSNIRLDWPYGISPGGIATNAYNGHVFWDSETWMYPPNLLMHPDLAATLLTYRVLRSTGAAEKATSRGYEGLMFPWESAFTGEEVCPWLPGALYENHITGDIAFALQQYFYATMNTTWLTDIGFPLLQGISTFWLSRVLVDPSNSSQYIINSVIPPDESAGTVNNSVYTNMVVAIALEFTDTAAKLLGEDVNPLWLEVANALKIPFDSVYQRHLEYDGYHGQIINQADVALLQWPLCISMNPTVAFNDLNYYENLTDPNGFFTGDSAYSIAWIALGDMTAAFNEFNKSFLHIVPPFNVWNEKVVGGHPHFITGAGGFLQNILFGYGGIRIQTDRIAVSPQLPVGRTATAVSFFNINYLGATFSLTYDDATMSIVQNSGPTLMLNGTQVLTPGQTVALARGPFFLQSI